ncbi:MAG: hypothetical protein AAGK00_17385 [Pseudomonadota bacterium]
MTKARDAGGAADAGDAGGPGTALGALEAQQDQQELYPELAEAIARHVHAHHYQWEDRINLPPIQTFDTMCASYFQIPAGVLAKLGLLRALDDVGGRWAFAVEPDGFADVVRANRHLGCSFDTLVLAAIELVGQGRECQELLDLLALLEICEPTTYRTRTNSGPRRLEDYANRDAWVSYEVPDFQVTWTARHAYYDRLRRDWVTLIA